jgi:hypothetical protein
VVNTDGKFIFWDFDGSPSTALGAKASFGVSNGSNRYSPFARKPI